MTCDGLHRHGCRGARSTPTRHRTRGGAPLPRHPAARTPSANRHAPPRVPPSADSGYCDRRRPRRTSPPSHPHHGSPTARTSVGPPLPLLRPPPPPFLCSANRYLPHPISRPPTSEIAECRGRCSWHRRWTPCIPDVDRSPTTRPVPLQEPRRI